VINGILFRVRTGIPWRDPPEHYGCWKPVHERHRRWSADGTRDRTLQALRAEADLAGRIDRGMVGVDSMSCRTHQHARHPRDQAAGPEE
jgi:transposase